MEQNFLVTRIFKAKYFHNTSFWDAQLGNNPSYVCHSLYATRRFWRMVWVEKLVRVLKSRFGMIAGFLYGREVKYVIHYIIILS